MRFTKLAAVVVGVLVPLGATASVQAAQRVPFTITEQLNFVTGFNTFTATGPLCSSGTFVDDPVTFAGPRKPDAPPNLNIRVRTVYTCDDGSGTFNMQKHVFVTFFPDSYTNTGPVQLLGGTGAYANLTGHGIDNGSGNGETSVGLLYGWVLQGPGA